jgi:DNA repair exonuclease SbcCD ATPase subunit
MHEDWIKSEAKTVARIRSDLKSARDAVIIEKKALKAAREASNDAKRAQSLIAATAEAVQQKVHERIAAVVSSCLSAVFDRPYEFKIQFEQKRGKTEANLRFLRNGLNVDPIDSTGGGVVDVAAFALRAACLVLNRPRLRRTLFLDEPFKNVSDDYQPAVRSMLEQVSKELGVQIVMVTHDKEYETGRIVRI